jgi:hypothetical protein
MLMNILQQIKKQISAKATLLEGRRVFELFRNFFFFLLKKKYIT